ncbi:MAG: Cof-type HAD-IIB family hydrolase [Candidatus Eremiobacteraeota bacterium]|nr:Cof-type HAD-IIB family hydrolase [Candidatus Eremiobacteraeota bacterium]
MRPPALIAVDLDGTLIGPSLAVDQCDRDAIAQAVARGSTICLATGRLFGAARPFAAELGLRGPMIVLNGAAIYDAASGARLTATPLAAATALLAYDALKADGFHLQLYYGDQLYLDELDERARHYLELSRVEPVMVEDLRRLLTDSPPGDIGPMKVLAIGAPSHVDSFIPRLADALGDAALVFKSQRNFLEVTDPAATKGHGLEWLAKSMGLGLDDLAAIGDSDNDVSMFEAAGHSFAVANSTPAARAAAQRVVAAQDKCGVAEALQLLANGQAVG